MNTSVNQGVLSTVPNGGVEYSDFQTGNGFEGAASREFLEELFDNNIKSEEQFINENFNVKQVSSGWKLREGGMIVGHVFISNCTEAYSEFIKQYQTNNEITELVEVDIFDVSEVSRFINLDSMSGDTIPTVCFALQEFDQNESYPDLPYNIEYFLK